MSNKEIIKLTNSDGKAIYLDVKRIVYFNISDSGENTYINLGGGIYVFVKETPEQVFKSIG